MRRLLSDLPETGAAVLSSRSGNAASRALAGRAFARYLRVMIGYVTLGTNDFERATEFYDRLLAEIGARRFDTSDHFVYYGKRRGLGLLAVFKPHDGRPASAGNGTMVALALRARGDVDRMHARALSLGARDEGAPGPRGERFYGAYFRDLDGNKLCAFTYENNGPAVEP